MAKKKNGMFAFGEGDEKTGNDGITKDQLSALAGLVNEYTTLNEKIEMIEEKLKNTKKDLDVLIKGRIPEIMVDAEIMNIVLKDGSKIKLDKKLVASVKKANQSEAIEWLTKEGFGPPSGFA